MKSNKKAINTFFIALSILSGIFSSSLGANVPLPNSGSGTQVWDNFNINSSVLENKQQTQNQATLQKRTESTPTAKLKTLPQSTAQNLKPQAQEKTTTPVFNIEPKAENIQTTTVQTETKQTEKITQDKADAISDTRNNAKLLYNANKLEEAQKAFSQIPDAQKISEDWLYLANIAQDYGKDMDAIFYLKKAIQADENNFKAHYNLGNIYLADEKVNMALEEYNKAIKAKKDFSYAYFNKGCAYLKKKSWFNAKYEFGLAIKNNPNEPAFYYNLAYTYKMMKKDKKANDVLAIYEKLMQQ